MSGALPPLTIRKLPCPVCGRVMDSMWCLWCGYRWGGAVAASEGE